MAGQDIYFPGLTIPELSLFEIEDIGQTALTPDPAPLTLSSSTVGWVGEQQRQVQVWAARNGTLLKVSGGSDFFISADGRCINRSQSDLQEVTGLDREILLGPALVLALVARGIWSLHASAAIFKNNLCIFLGESGQGKSTLAAYLSQSVGWRLISDDILPVKIDSNGVNVLPHFPQLKLPTDAQPAVGLPEVLPLKTICVLTHAEPSQMPELQLLSTAQTVQSLLSHMAGTRMFNASLLAKHMEFSAQVAKQIPAYRLIHPHRRDTLPLVREFLEKLC